MNEDIILIIPTIELKNVALDYKREHFANREQEINGSELWDRIESYEEWLMMVTNSADEKTVSPDWVVTDTYFAARRSDSRIIGMIDLRHTLKGILIDFGHIGYSVRPTERRNGYATAMLSMVLKEAKKKGLQEVQLSCKKSNLASVRTIEKNGGQYVRSFLYDGTDAEVYRILL